MSMSLPTVLVVASEPGRRMLLALALRYKGLAVQEAAIGQEAVDMLQRQAAIFRAVVLDLEMSDLDGWAVVERLRAIAPAVKWYFVVGDADPAGLAELTAAGGPVEVFSRPLAALALADRVWACVHARSRP